MAIAPKTDYIAPLQDFVRSVFKSSTSSRRNLDIANHHVLINSSSPELTETLIPAIEHLSTESDFDPNFTIYLVDVSQTRDGKLPVIPWGPLLRRGHRGIHIDGVYIQYVHIVQTGAMILSVYDMDEAQAYYIVNNTNMLPWYICGAPLHEIFYWWARSNGMHILHSGVIGSQNHGIALLGSKGAGKSTLVLTALENGFYYVSEDYCIVTDDEVPIAYSLYNSAKFTDYTLSIFPHLSQYKMNGTAFNDKHLVYYKDIYPGRLLRGLPLKAFVSLALQDSGPSRLNRLDANRAYLDMISSTTLQNPIYEMTSTCFFQRLKEKSSAYKLVYSSDTSRTLGLLSELVGGTTQ